MSIMILALASPVNAEISLWQNQLINGEIFSGSSTYSKNFNSTVQDHLFYQFDDTSIDGTGKNKPILLWLRYSLPTLPFTSGNSDIDWCNVTIRHFKNVYNGDGNRISVSLETQSVYIDGVPPVDKNFYLDMRSDDTVSADIYCHYTNSSALYETAIPVGAWNTNLPSFECAGCSDKSLEILTNELDTLDNRLSDQSAVYSILQGIINFNFSIWLILKWLISFSFLLVAIGLLFYSMYFIYSMIKNLEREI